MLKKGNIYLAFVLFAVFLFVVFQYSKKTTIDNTSNGEVMVHDVPDMDEKKFLFEMIPHHLEAVEVTNELLKKVSDKELKAFMENVIEVQSKEVADMKIWYKNWYGVTYDTNPNYKLMMGEMSKFSGRDLEKVYIEGMIFHHKGAVEMAKSVLKQDLRNETKKLAENIIESQEAEITLLESWLTIKYADVKAKDSVQHQMGTH